jgi:hypothetical protein
VSSAPLTTAGEAAAPVKLAGFFIGDFLKGTGPAEDVAFSNVGTTYRF